MKAAIYVRQSLDMPEGIERGLLGARQLVQDRGWDLVGEFIDNAVSASKERGPGTDWAKMIGLIKSGAIEAVVGIDMDRLLRRVQDVLVLIEAEVTIVTLDGDLDTTTAEGERRAVDQANAARFEVRRKGERQIRANARRAAQGGWVGGRRPFGFESDGLTLREGEANAVRAGYRALITGATLAGIARSWNEQGFTTGQARQARSGHPGAPSPWRADAVRAVLLNPRYVGQVRYKGEIMTAPAKWPAVVDGPTFAAAKAVLLNPSRRSVGRGPSRILTGLAVCGVCGATVHAGANSRPGVRSYRCSASMGHFARMAEPVESYVEAVVVARLTRPDARDLLLTRRSVDTDALHLESVGLRARLESLAVEFADGDLEPAQLRAITERIRDKLRTVEAQLADAGRIDALGELVAASDVAAVWESRNLEQKRAAISALMRVTLYPPGRGTRTFRPETVGIDWIASD